MGEVVTVERKIFGRNSFSNIIDTEFRELVPAEQNSAQNITPATVEKFFEEYNTLFYDIPVSGSDNSHEALVVRSSDYIGISIEEMEEEIRQLREENVALRRQLFTISNPETR